MSKIKRVFKVPCEWASYGVLRVEASSIEEAIRLAKKEAETCELPEAEYIDGSFKLNLDEDLIKAINK